MTLFSVDVDARTVSGTLIPYGELSRLNMSGDEPIYFERGVVEVPRDVSALNANQHHDRYMPSARFTAVEDTAAGMVAHFQIAKSEEGDDLLAAIKSGRLNKLSAEVRGLVRDGARAVRARLTGAAFCDEAAFASAGLFALAEDFPAHPSTPEADGIPQPVVGGEPDESGTDDPTDPEEDTPSTDPSDEGDTMADAVIPEGVTAPTPTREEQPLTAGSLFSTLARTQHMSRDAALDALQPYQASQGSLFAPLADITHGNRPAETNGEDDLGTVGIGGTIGRAQWLGQIKGGRDYERKVVPLIQHADLTALTITGWKWGDKPIVDDWGGNKSDIPSDEVTVTPVSVTASRLAGGNDVDRALADFGNEEWWASYFAFRREAYLRKSDDKAYTLLSNGATTVTPGTVPSGTDAGVAALVDGAIAVVTAGYTPTFALVSTAIFRTLLLTKKDNVLEYLAANVGLESGSLAGFKIVPHASLAAKRVIVGDRAAATFYELPGSPIRVNAIDVVKGGLDDAVYGYWAGLVNDAAGLASVTHA